MEQSIRSAGVVDTYRRAGALCGGGLARYNEMMNSLIKDICLKTRKQYSAEEKIRIVLDGLRGEDGIAELYRHEGIAQSLYYKWSKEFLEAGKRR